MLKILGSIESMIQPGEYVVEISDNSRVRKDRSEFDRIEFDESEIDGGKVDGGKVDNEVEKKSQKLFKFKYLFKSKKICKFKKILGSDFFTFGARQAFTKLRQVFVRAPIFYHFDPERYIRVEIDVSGYAISEILS